MKNIHHHFQLAIIGAGPVGLFTIFQAGMSGISNIAVFENLPCVGGQCSALYPEKPIYDIPAHLEISGQSLVDNLMHQAAPFAPTYFMNHQVTGISAYDDKVVINSVSDQTQYTNTADFLILSTGAGAFTPNRPPLDRINELENIQVFYSITNPTAFANKRVVIAGGGDSAVDWAILLAPIAKSITLVHRRPKFRASPASLKQLESICASNNDVNILTPFQLKSLDINASGILQHVIIEDFSLQQKIIPIDILLPCFGLSMDIGSMVNWGLELKNRSIIVEPSTMATNIPGVYAVGDAATYPGKLKLILSGFAEGAIACASIRHILDPSAPLQMEHSTSRGVPQSGDKNADT